MKHSMFLIHSQNRSNEEKKQAILFRQLSVLLLYRANAFIKPNIPLICYPTEHWKSQNLNWNTVVLYNKLVSLMVFVCVFNLDYTLTRGFVRVPYSLHLYTDLRCVYEDLVNFPFRFSFAFTIFINNQKMFTLKKSKSKLEWIYTKCKFVYSWK
jgi:hypothetical protein